MGAEQDDAYAARRAELDERFHALPPAGSPAYWRVIESDVATDALPLEVLVRCFQERSRAGVREDCARIFAVMVGRIQARTGAWARHIARQAPAARVDALADDLEQECYLALWRELSTEDDTFLAERFLHMLTRIEQHTAHHLMEREGIWRRAGVRTPTRIPGAATDRLEARRDEEQTPLSERLYDADAEEAFERIELERDVQALVESLPPDARSLLYDCFWTDLDRDEVAARYGVTDRTVRKRLAAIYAELRRLIAESQEDAHG